MPQADIYTLVAVFTMQAANCRKHWQELIQKKRHFTSFVKFLEAFQAKKYPGHSSLAYLAFDECRQRDNQSVRLYWLTWEEYAKMSNVPPEAQVEKFIMGIRDTEIRKRVRDKWLDTEDIPAILSLADRLETNSDCEQYLQTRRKLAKAELSGDTSKKAQAHLAALLSHQTSGGSTPPTDKSKKGGKAKDSASKSTQQAQQQHQQQPQSKQSNQKSSKNSQQQYWDQQYYDQQWYDNQYYQSQPQSRGSNRGRGGGRGAARGAHSSGADAPKDVGFWMRKKEESEAQIRALQSTESSNSSSTHAKKTKQQSKEC